MNIKGLRNDFEANLLDGDSIYDCGKAMMSAEYVWEWVKTAFQKYARAEVVKELEELNKYCSGRHDKLDSICGCNIRNRIAELKKENKK